MLMKMPSADSRYELLGELGVGGMATVYLARMHGLRGFSRLVAIKCMHPQYAKDAEFVEMFLDEARLSARIRHPNVVATHDIVAEEGQLLIVLEYVEGVALSELSRNARKMPVPIVCAIVRDLLDGLHAAHEAKDDDGALLGIIHRDVSPQNVLVGADGLARVLDFGIAKARTSASHTSEGEIKGKMPYMPPEQLFGEDIDRRVDVYAAGVVLWEALTRKRLFDAKSETRLVKQITEEPIVRPSVHCDDLPEGLETIVMRALSRLPDERFTTAHEMAQKIDEVVRVASRAEVAAWMKEHAAAALETRRDIARGKPTDRPSVAAVESVLKTLAPVDTSVEKPPDERKRRTYVLFAALGLAIVAAAIGLRFGRADAPAPAPGTIEPAPPPAPPPPIEEPSAIPIASAAPPSASAPPLTRPPVVGPRPKPAADSSACRPPFTVDSAGRRHYRAECL